MTDASRVAGEKAAVRNYVKYCQMSVPRLFVPLAFETLSSINKEGLLLHDRTSALLRRKLFIPTPCAFDPAF